MNDFKTTYTSLYNKKIEFKKNKKPYSYYVKRKSNKNKENNKPIKNIKTTNDKENNKPIINQKKILLKDTFNRKTKALKTKEKMKKSILSNEDIENKTCINSTSNMSIDNFKPKEHCPLNLTAKEKENSSSMISENKSIELFPESVDTNYLLEEINDGLEDSNLHTKRKLSKSFDLSNSKKNIRKSIIDFNLSSNKKNKVNQNASSKKLSNKSLFTLSQTILHPKSSKEIQKNIDILLFNSNTTNINTTNIENSFEMNNEISNLDKSSSSKSNSITKSINSRNNFNMNSSKDMLYEDIPKELEEMADEYEDQELDKLFKMNSDEHILNDYLTNSLQDIINNYKDEGADLSDYNEDEEFDFSNNIQKVNNSTINTIAEKLLSIIKEDLNENLYSSNKTTSDRIKITSEIQHAIEKIQNILLNQDNNIIEENNNEEINVTISLLSEEDSSQSQELTNDDSLDYYLNQSY